MRFQLLNKESPEKIFIYARNGSGGTLSAGRPTAFDMDGTRDGRDISSATTATATKATSLFAGVPPLDIADNDSGMIQVFGFTDNLMYAHMTRAASTDAWASYPALAVGDIMSIDTVGNGFNRATAGVASAFLGAFMAAQSLASATTLASTLGSAALTLTTQINAFLRAM